MGRDAYARASDAVSSGTEQLEGLDLRNAERSGVRDCVAALSTVAPVYADATLVVASDLRDNSDSGGSPALDGVPVRLVQPCPDGNAESCAAVRGVFVDWLSARGAGPVTDVRPEVTTQSLGDLISPTP